jgi:hypothetical protein
MTTDIDTIQIFVDLFLDACGIEGPPVDPFSIVRVFNQRAFRVKLPHGFKASVRKAGGLTEFLINNNLRYEQQCFSLAHEIFERILDENDKSIRHFWANRGASSLLMPEQFFLPACKETKYDLLKLKDIFSNVSYEAIAYRILHFRPGVITIYDNGTVTKRMGSDGINYPKKPIPTEISVYNAVIETEERSALEDEGISVQGWPVFEGNWKRVILFTEAD